MNVEAICRLDRAGVPLAIIRSIKERASYEERINTATELEYLHEINEEIFKRFDGRFPHDRIFCISCKDIVGVGTIWICESCGEHCCDACIDDNTFCRKCQKI